MLGQGGMGAVYKARDNELERLVALKIIRPDLTSNPEILKRFKQELILARQVTHRNVIRIFDLGQADGVKFITMEYLEGRDLRSVIKEKGKLLPEEAVKIVIQICRALEAAHGEGVIHRDLKPQNIMMDAGGRAYVMDFGIARSAELPGMTQTGALVGTPEYMSPEQAKGEKLDERSDLFSLGVMLYELLIGQSPYYSETPLATLWKRIQEKAKPPIEIDPTIPQGLSDIVAKALEIEPENRYATASEFALSLEMWLGVSPSLVGTFPGQAAAPAPLQRLVGWKYATFGLIVALIVVAAVGLPKKFSSGPTKAPRASLSVLVADFANHTGDPVFDSTLEPMFNVALEGASFINAFNRGTARKLAEKLPNPTNKLDEQSARLVAISQAISAVISGEINRRGDKYVVSAIALDAANGNTLAKSEASASSEEEVLKVIPKLAAPIRKALGDTTPESAQIEHAGGAFTVASLEVAHQYGLAMEEQFAGKTDESIKSFSKAAELDPNFARAYTGLAAAAIRMDREKDAGNYVTLAMKNVDRLTDRERFRVRGLYYGTTGNWQKCAEEFGALVKAYPGDNVGHNNLAVCLSELRNLPKAVEEARRDVELHVNAPGLVNVSNFSSYAGDFQGGEKAANELLEKFPNSEDGYAGLAFAQIGQGQLQQATETYGKLEKLNEHGASMASWGLADLNVYLGRYSDAIRILEHGAAADLAQKNNDSAAEKFAALAYAQSWMQRKGPAVAAAEKALADSQSIKIRFLAARVFVEAGQTDRAQKLATALAAEVQNEAQADSKIIESDLALKRKDTQHAIKALNDANALLDTWLGHFELGRAYLEANAFAEADSEFDQCIKRRGEALSLFMDEVPTYGYFPPVYYYQGRVREGLKSSGAADSYRTYLDIRGQAGEDPLLADIHRRLK
jgi:tetratricopeptide (TPR) repeat protein/predicted Ser/Thr protein kinase